MSESEPPAPQVGPRGESGMTSSQKNGTTLLVGCLSGVGAVIGVVSLIALALVGLVLFTCAVH